MDNKRFFSVMFVGLLVMLGWLWVDQYLKQKYPPPPPKVPEGISSPIAQGENTPPPSTAPTTNSATPGSTTSGSPSGNVGLAIVPAVGNPVTVTLGSGAADSKDYALGVELTSTGAGVDSVTLNQFKLHVDKPDRYIYQQPSVIDPDASRVFSTQALVIDGKILDTRKANWTLARADADAAVFTLDISRDGAPALRVTKTFAIEKSGTPSEGYEVTVKYDYANLGKSPATAASVINGTNMPPPEIERGPERTFVHAYLSQSNRQVLLRRTAVESFSAEKREIDMTKDDSETPSPLGWVGTSGAYFNAIVELDVPGSLAHVAAYNLNPDQKDASLRDFALPMQTASITLTAGQTSGGGFKAYFGPKKRDVLETPFYSAYPRNYDLTLVTTSYLCSFCTFPWLIRALVGLLNVFHFVVRDWGLAIIILVCVVRTLLHPITRKAQENIKRMSKMQPELERIKKKYADDKDGLNKAMMGFYKEQGATPVMGCLPMFLQTPIWLALYAGLQSTFELRHQPFLYGFTWIHDLAKPDSLFHFTPFHLPIIGTISGLNIIPFALAVVFFLQYKLTPKPPATTPEQEQQQKMMQWMTLIMPIFLYSAPAGLNIYILTSTSFGIIESKLIRDRIDRKEKLIAEGKIVDDRNKPKSSGIGNIIAKAQQWAEDMRNRGEQKN
jgi:YidC/Oxa1 family membrane protein insertase